MCFDPDQTQSDLNKGGAMARYKVQIKGLVRFSYLSEGGFAMSDQGQDAVRDILYDPARLDRRFHMFENLALHSIKRQKNPNSPPSLLSWLALFHPSIYCPPRKVTWRLPFRPRKKRGQGLACGRSYIQF